MSNHELVLACTHLCVCALHAMCAACHPHCAYQLVSLAFVLHAMCKYEQSSTLTKGCKRGSTTWPRRELDANLNQRTQVSYQAPAFTPPRQPMCVRMCANVCCRQVPGSPHARFRPSFSVQCNLRTLNFFVGYVTQPRVNNEPRPSLVSLIRDLLKGRACFTFFSVR